jgi:hypothetical protein
MRALLLGWTEPRLSGAARWLKAPGAGRMPAAAPAGGPWLLASTLSVESLAEWVAAAAGAGCTGSMQADPQGRIMACVAFIH